MTTEELTSIIREAWDDGFKNAVETLRSAAEELNFTDEERDVIRGVAMLVENCNPHHKRECAE